MAGGLVTLDLATKTGFACSREAGAPFYGLRRIGKPKCTDGHFFLDFKQFLTDLLITEAPRTVVFEAPILTGGQTSVQTARRLMGLAVLTDLIATEQGARVYEVNNMSVRKHFTGNGRAQKQDVINACRARGWSPEDDNVADALAIYDFSLHCLRLPGVTAGPLFKATA